MGAERPIVFAIGIGSGPELLKLIEKTGKKRLAIELPEFPRYQIAKTIIRSAPRLGTRLPKQFRESAFYQLYELLADGGYVIEPLDPMDASQVKDRERWKDFFAKHSTPHQKSWAINRLCCYIMVQQLKNLRRAGKLPPIILVDYYRGKPVAEAFGFRLKRVGKGPKEPIRKRVSWAALNAKEKIKRMRKRTRRALRIK